MVLLLASAAVFAREPVTTVMTKDQVAALVKRGEAAAKARDVEGVGKLFTPDARIDMTVSGGGPTQTLSLGLSDYLQQTRAGFAQTSNYRVSYGTPSITLSADGKSATVRQTTSEDATMMGQRMLSSANSVAQVVATPAGPRYRHVRSYVTVRLK